MKNLKKEFQKLQEDVVLRIKNGQFEVADFENSSTAGYLSQMIIKVDDMIFAFSLHESRKFVCQHTIMSEFNLPLEEKHLYKLYEQYDLIADDLSNIRIKQLEKELEILKNKSL